MSLNLLRRTPVLSKKCAHLRSGNFNVARGLDKCANERGPLHDLPDWEYEDGTPAPVTKKQIKWMTKRAEFNERIAKLAALADSAAKNSALPKKPSIAKHRRRDVTFYFENYEEDALTKAKREGKTIL